MVSRVATLLVILMLAALEVRPVESLFVDGFEAGSVSAWSASVGAQLELEGSVVPLTVTRTGDTWTAVVGVTGHVTWLHLEVYGSTGTYPPGWWELPTPGGHTIASPEPGDHSLVTRLPSDVPGWGGDVACPCLLDLTTGVLPGHPGYWCVALNPGQTPPPWWAGIPTCPVWGSPP